MKTLMTLGVLQTIGIVALVVHAFRAEHPGPQERAANPSVASLATAAEPAADDERLRAIIREELSREHVRPAAANDISPATPKPPRAPTAADLQQRDAIAQQIEIYRAAGTISETQMLELQSAIATLDDASRTQMMGKLMKALNSGDIRGRL
jgi:hypothetical protein